MPKPTLQIYGNGHQYYTGSGCQVYLNLQKESLLWIFLHNYPSIKKK